MEPIYVNWTGQPARISNCAGTTIPEIVLTDGSEAVRIAQGRADVIPNSRERVGLVPRWVTPALPAEEDGVWHVVSEKVASFLSGYRNDLAYLRYKKRDTADNDVTTWYELVHVVHGLPDEYRADQRTGTYTDPRTVDNDETADDHIVVVIRFDITG